MRRSALVAIPLSAAMMSLHQFAASAQQDYQEAIALYKNHKYADAAARFGRAWRNEPTNATAGYYASYCLYMAGKREDAIASFWVLADGLPGRKEAAMAREMLAKIDPDFSKHVPGMQGKNVSAPSSVPVRKSVSADELINRLVNVEPPKGKIPAVTPAFEQRVKELLGTVPIPVLKFVVANGVHIKLMPSVVELDYRIQNTRPRGWDEGNSWANNSALTHGKTVVVSQYRLDSRTGEYADTFKSDELGSVRHELGHALDHCLDGASESEEFKHAYLLDAAKVPEERRSRLDYFLQKSAGGPSETFAELCCYQFGGETGTRKESCDMVNQYFPQTRAVLEKYLKNIAAKNP